MVKKLFKETFPCNKMREHSMKIDRSMTADLLSKLIFWALTSQQVASKIPCRCIAIYINLCHDHNKFLEKIF